MVTTVYHAGDFANKAEDLYKSAPGRGTGFFGTGYYFTTTPEKCAIQGKGRPIYSFNIQGLNLFWGTVERHEKLKDICRIISFWPWLSVDMKNWWNLLYSYEKIFPYFTYNYRNTTFGEYIKSNYEYSKESHPDWYNDFTDYFGDEFNEKNFIERCNNIPDLQPLAVQLKSKEPNFELIDSIIENSDYFDKDWYNKINENIMNMNSVYFSFCDEDEFKTICKSIYEDLKQYYNNGVLVRYNIKRGLDSITTRFLKALGYDGVYPSSECDNTSYGGVVFEMPNNIKQVGEAKDYIHNNRKCGMIKQLFSTKDDVVKYTSNKLSNSFTRKSIFSNMFGIETTYTLTEIASYLAAFFFDMRNLHVNTTGDSFYTYHEVTQNLYEKAEEFYDDLVETAINFGELAPMMNENLPSDWNSYNVTDCSTAGTKSTIASELQIILGILDNIKDGYPSMVYSKIDSMSEYFDKELFKIKQALKSSRNVFSNSIKLKKGKV